MACPYQVCEWRSPEDLTKLLDLELGEAGQAPAQTLQHCRDAIHYSVKTSMDPRHNPPHKWVEMDGSGRINSEMFRPAVFSSFAAGI